MLPGSPRRGRRRRLINGVRGVFSDNTYAAVQESSSSDVRKEIISSSRTRNTAVFQPTFNASEEHGYRIDVAKDGSMITAVPIAKTTTTTGTRRKNSNNTSAVRRTSPILYSDVREVSPNYSLNQSLSKHDLMDARGNQRQKMKRVRPPRKTSNNVDIATSLPDQHNNIDVIKSPIRFARDQLRKAKGLAPTFSGSPNNIRQQAQIQSAERGGRVAWDLDEQTQSTNLQKNSNNIDEISFGSFPILSNHSFGKDLAETINKNAHTGLNVRQEDDSLPFETILQRRMEEIQSRQAELKKTMTHKDMMRGTLISAFDQNLEKNRKKLTSLQEELETIRWHLSLEDHERDKNFTLLRRKMEQSAANNQAADPMPSFDLESVGDPSITADTDSVADLFNRANKARQKTMKGMDPPERPSPSPPTDEESFGDFRQSSNLETKDPKGSKVSVNGESHQRQGNFLKKPTPLHPAASAGSSSNSSNLREKQIKQTQNVRVPPPRSRKSPAKMVHFNLPHESAELKYDLNDSIDNPSSSFVQTRNDSDDLSWQGGHFDVDEYDEKSGGLISSEHHDIYQWKDNKRHVVTSEHYVKETHHRRETDGRQGQRQRFKDSRGISSASVESDPDLSFVHAVAAVVIQTAVRRFLAELVAEERRYAVQVIQSAVCDWTNRRFSLEPPYYTECTAPVPYDRRLEQRTKRVMFEDEYNDVFHFAATEIQRYFRGWLARDTLEVDDFAATTIQRVFRGWWMRETLDVDKFCAVEIQRIVRGHLARMNYIYDLYCITVAQSVCRRFLAFNQSAIRLANVLYIQAIYRGYSVRSKLSRYVVEGQEVAATLIQAQWRSYDAQMHYINTLADILIVQSVARRWLTQRREEVKSFRINKRTQQQVPQYNTRKQKIMGPSSMKRHDSHDHWKEHRLKVVAKKKQVHTSEYPEAFSDILSTDSMEDIRWYDGNVVSETSNFLQNWRGRKSH